MVCRAAGALMRRGMVIFCPMAHSLAIAEHGELPTEWTFWKMQDEVFLAKCDRMIILTLDGYDKSIGIADERIIFQHMGKPIDFMTYEEAICGLRRLPAA